MGRRSLHELWVVAYKLGVGKDIVAFIHYIFVADSRWTGCLVHESRYLFWAFA